MLTDIKPVRKITRSASSLRGFHPSAKTGQFVQLESALERDFCCLLEFGPDVLGYVEQPITIEYEADGRTRRYTPDFLVQYAPGRPATLVEVKYRADLRANWAELKPKFVAAKRYAATKGWEFLLYTEVEIQNAYLKNARFLLRFQQPSAPVSPVYQQLLLDILAQLDEATPAEVLLVAFQDADRQAEVLPVLWHLVSRGLIGCNLYQSLTMQSQLWSVQ